MLIQRSGSRLGVSVCRTAAALAALSTAFLLVAGAAQAANATVTIRIEGANSTLVGLTQVTTPSGTVSGDGGAHTCAGNTEAGAIDVATHGAWSGAWDQNLGQSLDTILGETHTSSTSTYWSQWINHAGATAGICSTTLQPGDDVLILADCYSPRCPSPSAVLGTSVPATAQRGSAFQVSVTSYDNSGDSGAGTPSPADSATVTVTPGGQSLPTDAQGHANVTIGSAGSFTLQATKSGTLQSEIRTVCVHDGNDGTCGTTAPAVLPATGPAPGPATAPTNPTPPPNPGPVLAPASHGEILDVRNGIRFAHGHGPRILRGDITPGANGLSEVRIRLERNLGDRCQGLDGQRERFVRIRCGVQHAPWVSVGREPAFSYLLPFALPRGRYVFDVEAVGEAGQAERFFVPGRNRMVFRVG